MTNSKKIAKTLREMENHSIPEVRQAMTEAADILERGFVRAWVSRLWVRLRADGRGNA
jgi:hypothetical protein